MLVTPQMLTTQKAHRGASVKVACSSDAVASNTRVPNLDIADSYQRPSLRLVLWSKMLKNVVPCNLLHHAQLLQDLLLQFEKVIGYRNSAK